MACGNIIEVDPTGQSFWIPEERKEIVSGYTEPTFMMNMMAGRLAQGFDEVLKVFKKDGPQSECCSKGDDRLGYDAHKGGHHHHAAYHAVTQAKHNAIRKHFESDYLVKLGVREKLEQGIDVLDVGCGQGMQIMELGRVDLEEKDRSF